MDDRGKLERLVIRAFEKPDYAGATVGEFEAYVNPHEITQGYEMEYDNAQGSGTTNSRMEFKKVKPGDLSLTFFVDGTGVNGRSIDVRAKVQQFQSVTGYNGKIHRPNYLMVMWGTLEVKRCILKSAAVNYKLFKPDGVPLRAIITATFTDNSDDQTRVAKEQPSSPDLSHVRRVAAGDTLPRLCYEIYGDPRLYVAVAQANGITEFRNLPAGTAILFPPLAR